MEAHTAKMATILEEKDRKHQSWVETIEEKFDGVEARQLAASATDSGRSFLKKLENRVNAFERILQEDRKPKAEREQEVEMEGLGRQKLKYLIPV